MFSDRIGFGQRFGRGRVQGGDIQLYLLRWNLKNSGKLLTFILPGISSIAWMVFYFGCFATLGDKKQALHDIIAKSAVYKKADITG